MEITPAKDLKATHKADFEKSCESVMRAIEKANAAGLRDCCFNPYHIAQYDAVKAEFIKHGYTFKPTGIIGGVRQDSEQICW